MGLIREQLEKLFAELNERVETINQERREEGFFVALKAKVQEDFA